MVVNYSIRPMVRKDCRDVFGLAFLQGWDFSYEEIEEKLIHFKDSAFVIVDQHDSVIGSGLAMPFEEKARIANVIVHPYHRGKGLGKAMVAHLIDHLKQTDHHYIELTSSVTAHPIYLYFDFKTSYQVLSWQKTIESNATFIQSKKAKLATIEDLDALADLDATAFGANRRLLFETALSAKKAFLIDREKGKIAGFIGLSSELGRMRIGPWIHETKQGAEKLLKAALGYIATETRFDQIFLSTPAINQTAIELIAHHGFKEVQQTSHMYFGQSQEKKGKTAIYYGMWSLAEG